MEESGTVKDSGTIKQFTVELTREQAQQIERATGNVVTGLQLVVLPKGQRARGIAVGLIMFE